MKSDGINEGSDRFLHGPQADAEIIDLTTWRDRWSDRFDRIADSLLEVTRPAAERRAAEQIRTLTRQQVDIEQIEPPEPGAAEA